MNALAGGGSFVTLPALIAAGVPSVMANASSTVALYPGGLASAWAYRAGLRGVCGVPLPVLVAVTLAGGFCGSLALLLTPSSTFDLLVPWLLLVACLALAFGRRAGEALRRVARLNRPTVLVLQFGLGCYGGYFGGAVGIMMMAMWCLLDTADLKALNPPRTLLVSAANTMAVLTFTFAHAVWWRQTLVVLLGGILGGYIGALLGRRLPPQIVRAGTITLTAAMTIAFFIRAAGHR